MRASTALACLACVGAMSAGCTLLNSGDDLLRDSGVHADSPMGPPDALTPDAFVAPPDAVVTCSAADSCPTGSYCAPSNVCKPMLVITVHTADGGEDLANIAVQGSDSTGTVTDTAMTATNGTCQIRVPPGGRIQVGTTTYAEIPPEMDGRTITHSMQGALGFTTTTDVTNSTSTALDISTGCSEKTNIAPMTSTIVGWGPMCESPSGVHVAMVCHTGDPDQCNFRTFTTAISLTDTVDATSPVDLSVPAGFNTARLDLWVGNRVFFSAAKAVSGGMTSWNVPTELQGVEIQPHLLAFDEDVSRIAVIGLDWETSISGFTLTTVPPEFTATFGPRTSWETPITATLNPTYYRIGFSSDVEVILPGTATSWEGTPQRVTACWDTRYDTRPYADALERLDLAELGTDSVLCTSATPSP